MAATAKRGILWFLGDGFNILLFVYRGWGLDYNIGGFWAWLRPVKEKS